MGDDVDLEASCRNLHEAESPPYWAFCWGSGQALARWLLDHADAARGRRVVDLGCGSGVAAIAAGLAGARQVIAVDVDAAARQVTRANARANGLSPERLQVRQRVPEHWDLLLASDVLYDASLRPEIQRLRQQAVERGATLLAGEPERPGNAGHDTDPIARYAVRTFPDVDSPTRAARLYCLSG